MLHKLLTKFPKMVKMVKDPQQTYFENLQKRMEKEKEKKEAAVEEGDTVEDEDVEDLDASDEL